MLGAVEHLYEDVSAVRRPGHVGEVALFVEVGDLERGEDMPFQVGDAQGDVFGCHPGHRVTDQLGAARPGGDVIEGVERDGRLVLAVHRQAAAVRGGEDAAIDAELVAAHGLAIDDAGPLGLRKFPFRRLPLRQVPGQLAVSGPEQADLLRIDGTLRLADGLGHGQHPRLRIAFRMRREHTRDQQDQGADHSVSPPVMIGISVAPVAGEMDTILSTI